MKRIVRINQKHLEELLMREAGQGFLGDDPNFQGGSYRQAEPTKQPEPVKMYEISFTEEEINFIEDVLSNVHPDNKQEENILFIINHKLRDGLVNKK